MNFQTQLQNSHFEVIVTGLLDQKINYVKVRSHVHADVTEANIRPIMSANKRIIVHLYQKLY